MSRKRGRPKIKHGYVTKFDNSTSLNPEVSKTAMDAFLDGSAYVEEDIDVASTLDHVAIYKLQLVAVVYYDRETRKFGEMEFEELKS